MRLKEIHNVYFIGIGGIGMSALARYFSKIEKHVAGYDKTKTEVTSNLEKNGIQIHFNDSVALIPKKFQNKKNTLVVFTPAVKSNHLELNFFRDQGFQIMKRAEVLGLITENTFCFAVAGTHGKTTTSAILGHIMLNIVHPLDVMNHRCTRRLLEMLSIKLATLKVNICLMEVLAGCFQLFMNSHRTSIEE